MRYSFKNTSKLQDLLRCGGIGLLLSKTQPQTTAGWVSRLNWSLLEHKPWKRCLATKSWNLAEFKWLCLRREGDCWEPEDSSERFCFTFPHLLQGVCSNPCGKTCFFFVFFDFWNTVKSWNVNGFISSVTNSFSHITSSTSRATWGGVWRISFLKRACFFNVQTSKEQMRDSSKLKGEDTQWGADDGDLKEPDFGSSDRTMFQFSWNTRDRVCIQQMTMFCSQLEFELSPPALPRQDFCSHFLKKSYSVHLCGFSRSSRWQL